MENRWKWFIYLLSKFSSFNQLWNIIMKYGNSKRILFQNDKKQLYSNLCIYVHVQNFAMKCFCRVVCMCLCMLTLHKVIVVLFNNFSLKFLISVIVSNNWQYSNSKFHKSPSLEGKSLERSILFNSKQVLNGWFYTEIPICATIIMRIRRFAKYVYSSE